MTRSSLLGRPGVRLALTAVIGAGLVPALAVSAQGVTLTAKATAPVKAKAPAAKVVATSCTPLGLPGDGTSAVADLDGDAVNDFAVGLPGLFGGGSSQNGGGGVELALSSAGRQRLYDGTFAGDNNAFSTDAFGSAVTIADLDHDLCGDLIAGASGDSFTSGRVNLVFGTPAGARISDFQTIQAPTPTNGDGFGAAVAVALNDTRDSELWIGAPNTKVGGVVGAGAVYQYHVATDGTLTLRHTFTEASAEIGLVPSTGDHFGAVLFASYAGSVVVGDPDRTVSGHAGAGMVVTIQPDPGAGSTPAAQVITQDSTGIPGTAEAGDHFGASVSYGIVGVPGEDIGSIKDAGAVQRFGYNDTAPYHFTPGPAANENTAGVPGTAVAGDKFGASVAAVFGTQCQEVGSQFIGVPGKDIGKAKDAGAVIVLAAKDGALSCPAVYFHQSGLLPGTAESGDQVGASLAVVESQEGLDEDSYDQVLVGVPGEDLGTVKDAGVIDRISHFSAPTSIESVNGPTKGLKFGAVIGGPPSGQTFG